MQRADHAVASAVLVQTEDMAGAFAAVQPAAFFELLEYVAVADFGACERNAEFFKGFDWENHAPLQAARAHAEQVLGDTGRILIRASGTEPLVRVMVEAQDATMAREQAQLMADSLKS